MSLIETFGENVRKYRKAKGLTQAELAEKCELVPNYISEIETGRKFPSPGKIEDISSALQVQPFELFITSESARNREVPAYIKNRVIAAAEEIIQLIEKDSFIPSER